MDLFCLSKLKLCEKMDKVMVKHSVSFSFHFAEQDV